MRFVAVTGVVLAAPVLASPASASEVRIEGIYIRYTAGAVETNNVTITKPSPLIFRIDDPGVTITPVAPCQLVADHVECPTQFGMVDSLLLDTGDGNDTATFSSFLSADVTGGSGNDVLTVGSEVCSHRLKGGAGDDTLNGSLRCGSAELLGEGGNDTLNGTDRLNGGEGDDVLVGSASLDTLTGGPGADVMHGGGERDTVFYTDRTAAVTVDLDGSADDDGELGEGDTVGADIENVEGGAGPDNLIGNAERNRLRGWGGNDTLVGGDASDWLSGDAGDDVEIGGPGDETFGVDSDAGDDTWDGSEGDDFFSANSGNGADTMIGGPGTDRVSYEYAFVAVNVTLDDASGDGAVGENDSVGSDIEEVVSGGGNDTLVGSDANNFLDGGSGNDTISGAGGNDVLNPGFMGYESNVLNGGPGTDSADYSRLYGVTVSLDGVANDGQSGSSDNVGTDVEAIIGGNSNDTLTGNAGPNLLQGGEGADLLEGGGGADTLSGGDSADTLDGGAGNDTLSGGLHNDDVRGGPDADVVSYAERTSGVIVNLPAGYTEEGFGVVDTLTGVEDAVGGAGDDELLGNDDLNRLTGGSGDDVIDGGLAADFLIGGPGADVVDYSERTDPVGVNLENETGPESDILLGFEGIWGGSGGDSLFGSSRDDTINGGLGADVINGGVGFDVVDYSDRVGDVYAAVDGGFGNGEDGEGDYLADNLEGIFGGAGDDELGGNDNANELDGGPGDDLLDGGLGADELDGGPGFDIAAYSGRAVAVFLDLDSETGDDGAVGEGDTIGATLEGLAGGSGNDVLNGNDAANDLYGGPGLDQLEGRGGDDLLNGGTGADSLSGGAGFDLSDYAGRSGGVSVDLDGAAQDDGEPGEGDTTWGDVEDVAGGAGNDTLAGNGGENFLFGRGGNDSLDGGRGADLLFGGDGDDGLLSRDNEFDENDCGSGGADSATIDWFDLAVGCEQAAGPAPHVATGGPSEVTHTTARVSAAINPLGNATAAYWELGPTTAYGTRTASVNLAASAGSTMVSTVITGLSPGTTYHYRSGATNGGGTTYGVDLTFTTLRAPAQPPPPRPPARRCVVARVVGQRLAVARRSITRRRCRVGKITRRPSRVVRAGIVLAQRPKAGTRLPRGSKVSLVVSSGKPRKRGR